MHRVQVLQGKYDAGAMVSAAKAFLSFPVPVLEDAMNLDGRDFNLDFRQTWTLINKTSQFMCYQRTLSGSATVVK